MTSLREVIGSVVGAVGEAHLAADARAAAIAKNYETDDFLRVLPVPRVTLRNATMRLKFAVSGESMAPNAVTEGEAIAETWLAILKKDVAAEVIEHSVLMAKRKQTNNPRAQLTKEEKAEIAREVEGAVKVTPRPSRRAWAKHGRGLLDGETSAVAASVREVLQIKAKTTNGFKARLTNQNEIRRLATTLVQRRLGTAQKQLRIAGKTARAKGLDLEVDVQKSNLEGLAADQVHELELTFDVDGVEPSRPDGTPAALGRGD